MKVIFPSLYSRTIENKALLSSLDRNARSHGESITVQKNSRLKTLYRQLQQKDLGCSGAGSDQ